LTSAALTADLWALIGKYGAQLSSMGELSFVVSKTGSVEESLVPFEEL